MNFPLLQKVVTYVGTANGTTQADKDSKFFQNGPSK
jgi:hypothetical protein